MPMVEDVSEVYTPCFGKPNSNMFASINGVKPLGQQMVEDSRSFVGFDFGVSDMVNYTREREMIFSFTMTLDEIPNITEFLSFLSDRNGQTEKFWWYCPISFFEVTSDISAEALTVSIYRNEYEWRGFERFFIYTGDLLFVRPILSTSTNVSLGITTLYFTNDVGYPIEKAKIDTCGLLYLVRFTQDSFDVKFKTTGVVECDLTVKELILEYPTI